MIESQIHSQEFEFQKVHLKSIFEDFQNITKNLDLRKFKEIQFKVNFFEFSKTQPKIDIYNSQLWYPKDVCTLSLT